MGDLRRITERYRLDKLESSSEGGSVFRGVDLQSGETVAVELIERLGGSEETREQFLETAAALRSLAHPALPRVIDSGFTNAGSAFLVTEYLHGTPFEQLAGAVPGRLLSLLLLLVDGLEALAGQGIVHRDLRLENLLVTPGDEGEQVKILGLGSAEPGLRDLRAFGLLACRALRAPIEPQVGIPLEVAVDLQDIEALRALLEAALKGDPERRYPTWMHVRNALRRSLFGAGGRRVEVRNETIVHPPDGLEEEAGTRPDAAFEDSSEVQTQVFSAPEDWNEEEKIPEEELTATVVLPPAEEPPVPAVAAPAPRKRLPVVLGVSAAAVMAVATVAFSLLPRSRPQPSPVSHPAPPPPVPAALGPAIPVPAAPVPEETTPEVTPEVTPSADPVELAGQLTRALEKGDLRALGSSVAALSTAGETDLPAEVRKSMARARRALAIGSRLSQAQKAGSALDVIRQSGALLAEMPRARRVAEQRERAAANLEREADAEIETGRFDDARGRLEGLRQAWPERAGLAERLDRVAAERRVDQDLEDLLLAAGKDEKAGKPLDGLQRLAAVRPNARWADRFQETRQRLEAQAAELDRKPPEVALRGSEPAYEKGKTGVVSLRVTDDAGVKAVEGWARAEGGSWVKVGVRHLSGPDYYLEVPPDVHQNRNVEYYAVATDASGHTSQLGSPESPRKMKRKNWIEKLLGGREKNGVP